MDEDFLILVQSFFPLAKLGAGIREIALQFLEQFLFPFDLLAPAVPDDSIRLQGLGLLLQLSLAGIQFARPSLLRSPVGFTRRRPGLRRSMRRRQASRGSVYDQFQ